MKNLTLIQRLWLLISVTLFMAIAGALLANLFHARQYLEDQLSTQNTNTANSLALQISQNQAEPAMAETLINATFDQGHFRQIVWLDLAQKPKVLRQRTTTTAVPGWFRNSLPVYPAPGEALVSSGWLQAGTLRVQTDVDFAYITLWDAAWQTVAWLLLASLLPGLAGTLTVRQLRRQLQGVVEQAEAIQQQRFILMPDPSIPELGMVSRAMNHMVEHIKHFISGLTGELEELQRQKRLDPVTGLINRDAFEQALKAKLGNIEEASSGQLLLIHIHNLEELNRRLGGGRVNQLLMQMANELRATLADNPAWLAARLRGADFALLCPELEAQHAEQLAAQLCHTFGGYHSMGLTDQEQLASIGLTSFHMHDSFGAIMSRGNEALGSAEHESGNQWARVDEGGAVALASELDWRELLINACQQRHLQLRWYPVCAPDGSVLWQEGMVYLPGEGGHGSINALKLVSHALRHKLTAQLDLCTLQIALTQLPQRAVALNLTPASLQAPNFSRELFAMVRKLPVEQKLTFEFHENGLLECWAEFMNFATEARKLSHQVAVEISGQNLGMLTRLNEVGIAYLVIDGSLTHGIASDDGRQAVFKGLREIASLVGTQLVAKGISQPEDGIKLGQLGAMGLTGPAIGQ